MRLVDVDEMLKLRYEDGNWIYDLHDLPEFLQYVPTIEVEPVKHGKWVDRCVRSWYCSECEKEVPRQVWFDGYCYDDKLNYCPNCGAKMDGE